MEKDTRGPFSSPILLYCLDVLAPRPAVSVKEKGGGDRLRGKWEGKALVFSFHKEEEQLSAAWDGADVGEKCFFLLNVF